MIRAAAMIQLLLGNVGRPGGGIIALRGHCSIQGSTDIPTLYNMLPSYLPQPNAFKRSEEHTSELQSLMRISYAVFCSKKKTYPYAYNILTLHINISLFINPLFPLSSLTQHPSHTHQY